jgi:hypothetical protein
VPFAEARVDARTPGSAAASLNPHTHFGNQPLPDSLVRWRTEQGGAMAVVLIVEDEEQVRVLAEATLRSWDTKH